MRTKTMPPMSSSPGWPAPRRNSAESLRLLRVDILTFEAVDAETIYPKTLRRLPVDTSYVCTSPRNVMPECLPSHA